MKITDLFKNEELKNKAKEVLGDKYDSFEALMTDDKEMNMIPYSRFNEVVEQKNTNEKMAKDLTSKLEKLSSTTKTQEEFDAEKTKIVEKDGKYEGLDEQLKTLKESYSDLFESTSENNNDNNIQNNNGNGIYAQSNQGEFSVEDFKKMLGYTTK